MKRFLLSLLIFGCAEPRTERYIVIQNSNVPVQVEKLRIYRDAVQGFTADLTPDQVRELEKRQDLTLVPDQLLQIQMLPADEGFDPIPDDALSRIGRGRVSRWDGHGVEVAVLDSGIEIDHPALKGSVKGGFECSVGSGFQDDNGHGSHVSAIIHSVAPGAKLWSIKVIDNSGIGTWADVLCGLDFVARNSPARGGNISVVNMSLGGLSRGPRSCAEASPKLPMLSAICSLSRLGVTIVVAAGNSEWKVEEFQPAGFDEAVITVSSISDSDGKPGGLGPDIIADVWGTVEEDDSFSDFTNWGPAIDIAAPGRHIRSAWLNGTYKTISGTSMSTPFVTGAAALYLSTHKGADWLEVRKILVNAAKTDVHNDGKHPEPILNVRPLLIPLKTVDIPPPL